MPFKHYLIEFELEEPICLINAHGFINQCFAHS